MLMIVTSWLSEVSFEFSMQQETLFLAVALLNRFLDASTVSAIAAQRNTASMPAAVGQVYPCPLQRISQNT
jgi:hypothetical protein